MQRRYSKLEVKDFKGAIVDFNIDIKINYSEPILFYNRGLIHLDENENAKSILDFDEAINLRTNYLHAYYKRGLAKANMGNELGACDDWCNAIKLGKIISKELFDAFYK